MSVWIGMTGGMDKHWGEKELPRVGHQLASCSLLISYVLIPYLSAPDRHIISLFKETNAFHFILLPASPNNLPLTPSYLTLH